MLYEYEYRLCTLGRAVPYLFITVRVLARTVPVRYRYCTEPTVIGTDGKP